MNGKERVRTALEHREADRVPIWELGFHNAVARNIMGREMWLSVGGGRTSRAVIQANMRGRAARQETIGRIVDDTLTFYRRLGYDMVRFRPTDFLTPFAFGSGNWSPIALLDGQIREIAPETWRIEAKDGFWSVHQYSPDGEAMTDVDDCIKQAGIEELKRYVDVLERQPIDLSSEPLQDALDGIRQAVHHPAAREIFILGWGDVCYPGSAAHITTFLEAMITEPDLVRRYMETTTSGVVALVRAQASLGVDCITGGNDWAFKTGPMFSVRMLRSLIAPYLKRIVDETHRLGLRYIKHADGDMRSHLPVLVDEVGIDGLHAIEPDSNMDIVDLKRRYGGRLSLLGNLDCDLLARGTPAQIESAVIRLMREVAPGGGYVFSTSNSVLKGVPLENLTAMVEAAHRYGEYPIQVSGQNTYLAHPSKAVNPPDSASSMKSTQD